MRIGYYSMAIPIEVTLGKACEFQVEGSPGVVFTPDKIVSDVSHGLIEIDNMMCDKFPLVVGTPFDLSIYDIERGPEKLYLPKIGPKTVIRVAGRYLGGLPVGGIEGRAQLFTVRLSGRQVLDD